MTEAGKISSGGDLSVKTIPKVGATSRRSHSNSPQPQSGKRRRKERSGTRSLFSEWPILLYAHAVVEMKTEKSYGNVFCTRSGKKPAFSLRRQELFVAPRWTPGREDVAIKYCGSVGDEDTSLVERSEDRADRFENYSSKRESEALNFETHISVILWVWMV